MKVILAFVILSIAAVCGVSYWLYSSMNKPVQHSRSNDFIEIPKGSSPSEIVNKLAAEGVIASPWAIKVYLRTLGDSSKLKAGDYQFNSPITALQVIKELEKGEERTIKITIPEGWTRFDIAKRIVEKFPTEPATDEKTVLAMMDDVSLISDIDINAKNLEGYLYPSTYSFPIGTEPKAVVKRMVDQFRKTWKPEWNDRAKAFGRTPHEIVTIASLVETESKFDAERTIVASVIYNRLSRGMALGIDQTAVYIAKMENRWDGTINKSDLESTSPYNTRKFAGLPPGPIASASESALEAALNPQKTDYLFYVLNVEKNDGSHNFYASAAEFERGKAAYQIWLEEQRRQKREKEGQ
ncbi:MAG TPA: endolytic transglycosylase MltG [Pyrinomonadaceae bacterium]|nr:endolytic transglycosylase MltG [Pyrinomonadaceae bacterium]